MTVRRLADKAGVSAGRQSGVGGMSSTATTTRTGAWTCASIRWNLSGSYDGQRLRPQRLHDWEQLRRRYGGGGGGRSIVVNVSLRPTAVAV